MIRMALNDGEILDFEHDIGDDVDAVNPLLDFADSLSDLHDIDDIDGVVDDLDDDITRILDQSEDDGKDDEDIPDFRYGDSIWID